MTQDETIHALPSTEGNSESWIGITLAGQSYAAPVCRVQEVIRPQDIAPVPGAPAAMRGLMNLRGRLLPVLDGRMRLALRGDVCCDDAAVRVLVLDSEGEKTGLLVDAVGELIRFDENAIGPPPSGRTTRVHDPVRGVIRSASGFTALLDVTRLCDPDAIVGNFHNDVGGPP